MRFSIVFTLSLAIAGLSFVFSSTETFAQRAVKPAAKASKEELSSQSELVLKSVSERYAKLNSWSAPFAHESYSVALGTSRMSKGNFIFTRPNKFKFALNGPAEISDFISDGKQAWYVRFPEGRKKPAHVQYFKDIKNIELDKYLILLRGVSASNPAEKARVLKDFKVDSQLDSQSMTLLLSPRGSSDISTVSITFEQTKATPAGAQIIDSLGGEVTIKLGKAKSLKKLPKNAFKPSYHKKSQVEVIR